MAKDINQILNNLLLNKNQALNGKKNFRTAIQTVEQLDVDFDESLENIIETNLTNTEILVEKEKKENNSILKQLDTDKETYIENSVFLYKKENILDFFNFDENGKEKLTKFIFKQFKKSSTSESTQTDSVESNTSEKVSALLDKSKDNTVLNTIDDITQAFANAFSGAGEAGETAAESASNTLSTIGEYMGGGGSSNIFLGTLGGIAMVMGDNLAKYQDGVSETQFGASIEGSWTGKGSLSFLDFFKKENESIKEESKRKVNFLNSNPLDSGSERTSIYGSMMLGTPFLFNDLADPTNRTLINTLVKDAKYVSFTPGMPKFNGTSYSASPINNILNQTKAPTAMLNYLAKNGLDKDFAEKDKRYYTFQTNYQLYFSYLETMLNAIWVKMGLAKDGESFNLFTFFKIKTEDGGGIKPSGSSELKPQFNSSIGFFANVANAASESLSNAPGGQGDSLASRANQNASEYRDMNYLTGMGQGGGIQNAARSAAIATKSIKNLGGLLSETLGGTIDALSNVGADGGGIWGAVSAALSIAKVPLAMVNDITTFTTTNDLGALIQSFATANGMQVQYPNLWENSSYSKSVSLQFSFVSPYGDPLSIFKYVYVPFCALLCFAMPRQAAENGLVSPFLVRCDIPGVITSDMAIISDMSWTRGGANSLWTKDGLPRAIDVQISLADLYPYLSMTRRVSALSANPSYAVFLDSLSGMLALNDPNEDDGLNNYFKAMINRVNGTVDTKNTMWNRFNSKKSEYVKDISEKVRSSLSATVDPHAIPWLHNSVASE